MVEPILTNGKSGLSSPVAFLVFNRPSLTSQTFAKIREAQPRQLFVVADGPRDGHPTDGDRVAEVRRIVSQVDWPCEVETNLAETNMGCKARVSSGLTWVFSQVDRAIILEDDCLPHPDFFRFCDELLERYKDDDRVATITGNNFQDGHHRGDASYYFSKYVLIWGWATWKRVWDRYDGDISFWPEWRNTSSWGSVAGDPIERRSWERVFDSVPGVDTWDYPFVASTWFHGGLTAAPNVNLVSNLGFGPEALHTTDPDSPLAERPVEALGPVSHPERVEQDFVADRYTFDQVFGGKEARQRRTPWGFLFWLQGALRRRVKRYLRRDRAAR